MWRPITLEVALELLDYHFADERVRSQAVQRLEKLSNEELMLFLLQLTQVTVFTCVSFVSCFINMLVVLAVSLFCQSASTGRS